MSHSKIVKTRTAGWCSREFAHPGRINVGDRVKVTVYFPSDEEVHTFGASPLVRVRSCSWCVAEDEREQAWQDARSESNDSRIDND